MVTLPFRRVLALSPHTDDAEFGAGGTIARLVREGAEVCVRAFTNCGEDGLADEFNAAAEALDVARVCKRYPVREFHNHRQELLEGLVSVRQVLGPDLVLCPASTDQHQDHQVIHAEAVRAFRGVTTLGYEMPWNQRRFDALAHVRLEPEDVEKKLAAIRCYKSQAERPYAREEAIRGLLAARGVAAGCRYAEAFEVIRWVA